VVKVENSENHPSGAKARRLLSAIYGTAEAVPFQIQTFTTGCYHLSAAQDRSSANLTCIKKR